MKFISIRVIEADNINEAIEKVENGQFEDSHELCDKVIPMTEAVESEINHIVQDIRP